MSAGPSIYRFGSFEFHSLTGELRKDGMRVHLEGQPVVILAMMLDRPNELVTREDFQKKLWPSDTFVDFEQSLNAAIRRLRSVLDDSAESPRYIETLARRGYRWIAPLRDEPPTPTPEVVPAHPRSTSRRMAAWLVLAACTVAATIFLTYNGLRSRPGGHTVMLVVLPFQNLSEDPQQEYFADGMTEEMITQLGSLNPEQLGVIARTSALQYKTSHKNAGVIARELNVNYLLEGSVRRYEQRIRVTAQLIQASDQAQIWADSYDSDIGDILKVQSEVAGAIAGQIRLQLTPQTKERLANTPRVNALAHDAYLQGQHAWDLRDKGGMARSIEQFQRAIEIDPSYANAHAALARAYALSPVYGIMPALEAMPRARDAATHAIALDDSLAGGHSMMGFIKAHYEYDWSAAEQEFQKALKLNPSDPYAHLFLFQQLSLPPRSAR